MTAGKCAGDVSLSKEFSIASALQCSNAVQVLVYIKKINKQKPETFSG